VRRWQVVLRMVRDTKDQRTMNRRPLQSPTIPGPRLLVLAALAKTPNCRRVLCDCKATLDCPIDNDPFSRQLVLTRCAGELDIRVHELKALLRRE
jgi:hypothetical protein